MSDAPLALVAGGGTGGHLFPGLAVADRLISDGWRVAFVGTERGLEASLIPARGHTLHVVDGAPLRGRGVLGALRGGLATMHGVWQARALLRRLEPAVVLGVGGYASVATVVAAWLGGVPTVLQEQNAVAGAANRLLGRIASRVCLGFESAAPAFPAGRVVHTGNPVRAEIAGAGVAARAQRPLGLLVFGGSQGARRINDAMVQAVRELGEDARSLRVLHQTGQADHERIASAYAEAGVEIDVRPFIDDMPAAYAASDVVLARAGAMSCAEILVAGLPSILVPYPHAAGDHQRHNAAALIDAGAARLVPDAECTGSRLAAELRDVIDDSASRNRMAAAARALARPDAAAAVAGECRRIARESRRRA